MTLIDISFVIVCEDLNSQQLEQTVQSLRYQNTFNWNVLIVSSVVPSPEQILGTTHGNPRIQVDSFPLVRPNSTAPAAWLCTMSPGMILDPDACAIMYAVTADIRSRVVVFSLLSENGEISALPVWNLNSDDVSPDVFISGRVVGSTTTFVKQPLRLSHHSRDWLDEESEREKRWAAQVSYIDDLERQVDLLTRKCHTLDTHISNIEHHTKELKRLADVSLEANDKLKAINDHLVQQLSDAARVN